MFRRLLITRCPLCRSLLPASSFSTATASVENDFRFRRVLVLSKLSRYEYEKRRHGDIKERQLEALLRARGSDYTALLYHHYVHKACENTVVAALRDHGVDTELVNRFGFTADAVAWCDAIVTVGGDGTFLLAAARVRDSRRPVIGFNSDPTRSEGHLLLPRHCSVHVRPAIAQLLQGKFRWLFRQRIQVTLYGRDVNRPPIELHDQQLSSPEHSRYLDMDWLNESTIAPLNSGDSSNNNSGRPNSTSSADQIKSRVLPVLALNEVYIGECLSARVSYYEMTIDGGRPFKQKSSGLCISSGTGSSSWTYNINRLTQQTVAELMEAVSAETGVSLDTGSTQLISAIRQRVNSLLLFDPGDSRICYTIRDPILCVPGSATTVARPPSSSPSSLSSSSVSQNNNNTNGSNSSVNSVQLGDDLKPRGLARHLRVRSRCFDACLVLDGSLSFAFNDGTTAELCTRPDCQLRTVQQLQLPD